MESKNDDEIFSLTQLSNKFSLKQVQKKGAIWDEQKLHWISGQHMMQNPLNLYWIKSEP